MLRPGSRPLSSGWGRDQATSTLPGWRHGDRVQHAGTGGVGVGVDGEGQARRPPAGRSPAARRSGPRLACAGHLLVGQHQEGPGLAGRSGGPPAPPPATPSNSSRMCMHSRPPAPGRGPGQGHHLVGVGAPVGGVGQAAAQARRPGVHGRAPRPGPWPGLSGAGRPGVVVQAAAPAGCRGPPGPPRSAAGARPAGPPRRPAKVGKRNRSRRAQEVERGRGVAAQGEGRQADAAVAHHHAW